MTQKGAHTWDIVIEYQCCPKCKFIIENRQKYTYQMGKYQKEVRCNRCRHCFIATKVRKPSIGPLIGDSQPIETEWGDPR